jgi:hypothetical protein
MKVLCSKNIAVASIRSWRDALQSGGRTNLGGTWPKDLK